MQHGPIEFVIVKFPGNHLTGEIAPALEEIVEREIVRIIDLLFVIKQLDGTIEVLELNGLGDVAAASFMPVVEAKEELLSRSDAEHFGGLLEPNSSAALLLLENVWEAKFALSVRLANGEVIVNQRIPRLVIDESLPDVAYQA